MSEILVWSAFAIAAFWALGIYSHWLAKRASKLALSKLHRELLRLRWMGADDGWDNAIIAVRAEIMKRMGRIDGE